MPDLKGEGPGVRRLGGKYRTLAKTRSPLQRLIQDLEDLMGRKVDVETVKGLREYFRDRILNEAVPL